jgi:copper homeostasis protein
VRLEVIASSLEDALAAEAGGADRIELVRDLPSGGLTPPLELVDAVLTRIGIPVRVMVRETISHVVSDPRDRSMLIASARELAGRPVDGLVCGAVRDERADIPLVLGILQASGGKRATFHRAFESIADPVAALAEIGRLCGGGGAATRVGAVDRVLTNGGAGECQARLARLKRWVDACPPHLQIMLGGGVTSELVEGLPPIPGLREIHVGRAVREPPTDHGRVVAGKVEAFATLVHAMSA